MLTVTAGALMWDGIYFLAKSVNIQLQHVGSL